MKSFRELLGLGDPLLKQADTLVQVAEMNAITAFKPLLKKFSFLREVDEERWAFILTIAGVFIAVNQLANLGLGENRQRKLMGRVGAKLIQWDPTNGRRGFEDCASFYERTYNALTSEGGDPRFFASDPLGYWIVWNVLCRRPESEEEFRLVRAVGGMTHYTFSNWWKERSNSRH
jgi:hypothetical protein